MKGNNKMRKEKGFYNADELAEILESSRATAYRVISKLNEELKNDGYITISGKVPVKKFNERFYQ